MSAITPNQWTVLERLETGPCWIRSFQTVRPLVEDLISRGLVERCRPHLGAAGNMVRLTQAGCELAGIDPASVPAEREPEPVVEKPPLVLGEIDPRASDHVRSVCETFCRAVRSGTPPGFVVAQLAAANSVQRPAIWKTLRAGGVLPAYKTATGKQRQRAPKLALVPTEELPTPVHRDPCERCGVRADIGCSHRSPLIAARFG